MLRRLKPFKKKNVSEYYAEEGKIICRRIWVAEIEKGRVA